MLVGVYGASRTVASGRAQRFFSKTGGGSGGGRQKIGPERGSADLFFSVFCTFFGHVFSTRVLIVVFEFFGALGVPSVSFWGTF